MIFLRKPGYGRESIEKILAHIPGNHTANPRRISPSDVVIRWGNTIPVVCAREINRREAIILASNKLLARKSCGVPTPKSFGCWETLQDFSFPALVRPLHHTQGRDILVVNSPEEFVFSRGHYIAELLPKDREFRIFVAGGGVFGVAEKIPRDKSAVAWNHAAGAEFISVRSGIPVPACALALKATRNLGLDFCAVDVILTQDGFFFIEANTAFSLASAYRAERLAKFFLACQEEIYSQALVENPTKYSEVKLNLF